MFRRVTAPATLPVALDQAKEWLRVDHDADDLLIGALIAAAVDHLDGMRGILGYALEPQTWEMTAPCWPFGQIILPLGPVVSITSVKYLDTEGVEQTLPTSDYRLEGSRVARGFGTYWPATATAGDAVRVRWVAGTGTPPAVLLAIRVWLAQAYDKRDTTPDMDGPGMGGLLSTIRAVSL